MDSITFQVLLGHNPWLQQPDKWHEIALKHIPQPYIPRELSKELGIDKNKVHLVIGPRQAGRSTLIWHHLSTQPEPYLLINCEEQSCRSLCESPALFLKEIQEISTRVPGLFFEEIQHLPEAGLFLKGLVDLKPNVPILVTGSASYHLKSKTRESLAGRAIRHYMLPLSMKELSPENSPPLILKQKKEELLKDLVLWGGYRRFTLAVTGRLFSGN